LIVHYLYIIEINARRALYIIGMKTPCSLFFRKYIFVFM